VPVPFRILVGVNLGASCRARVRPAVPRSAPQTSRSLFHGADPAPAEATPLAPARKRAEAPGVPIPALLIASLLVLGSAARAAADPPRGLAELDLAFGGALAAYQAGDYEGSIALLRGIVRDLEELPPGDEAEAQWSRALLRLAHAEATVGRVELSREAMEALLALEPAALPDPESYSPSFRREFERARARLEVRPRLRLAVTSPRQGALVAVGLKHVGATPAEARLPAGRYRVTVADGLGEVSLWVDLSRDESVELRPPGPPPPTSPALAAAEGMVAEPLPPLASPEVGPGPPASPEPLAVRAQAPQARWMRPAAWLSASLAAVCAGVAAWQGIAASQYASEARALVLPGGNLAPGADPASYSSAAASYQSARQAAWIAGGAAVALSAGAAALFLVSGPSGVEAAPGGAAVRF